MARARPPSLARGRRPDQSVGPNHRLRRWLAAEVRHLEPVIVASAADCHAERYRKHFTAFQHACLLLFHGLSRGRSLTQSYSCFGRCRGLVVRSGLQASADPHDERIRLSFSQLAASNTSRPAEFLAGLVPILSARVRALGGRAAPAIPRDVKLLDGTFLRLSLALARWLVQRDPQEVPGVRLQVEYAPADDLPTFLRLTDSHTNDCQALDHLLATPEQLAAWAEQTLAIDLGYYSHRRFACMLAAGIHLVTRLHPQAKVTVTADYPIQPALPTLSPGRIQIQRDQRITLGSAANSTGAVLAGVRLVTATVDPLPAAARRGARPLVYRLITDRWDLTPTEIVQIYVWRWQIELFFRWLKHHVRLLPPLGYSRAALELTLWLSLVVHLLTVLATHALARPRRTPTILADFVWALAQLTPEDCGEADPVAYQLAFGESPLPQGASP